MYTVEDVEMFLILMFIEEARSYRTQLRNHNGAGRKQLCSLATLSTHLQNALQLRQPAPYRRPWLPAAIAFAQPCQHPFESVLPSVPASSPSLDLPSPSAVRFPISFASLLPLQPSAPPASASYVAPPRVPPSPMSPPPPSAHAPLAVPP